MSFRARSGIADPHRRGDRLRCSYPCLRACLDVVVLVAALIWQSAYGQERDIVFDCPCSAVWSRDSGSVLTMTFGIRSYRAADSGELRLVVQGGGFGSGTIASQFPGPMSPSLGYVPAHAVLADMRRTIGPWWPSRSSPIAVFLHERVARKPPPGVPLYRRHEILVLWPVPAENDSEEVRYVDIVTDADGDGTGDVNERLAGTSPENPDSRPDTASTVDVLALFNDGFRDAFGRDPYTRIHHLMVLANSMFVDSGTNIRLRTVGMREVELQGNRPSDDDHDQLMDRHGADVSVRFHIGPNRLCAGLAGCAPIGGWIQRGYWPGVHQGAYVGGWADATTVAHELGHVMGLVHSFRQSADNGAFRWSRGHYVDRASGTIMTYGKHDRIGRVFSNPASSCDGDPCGSPIKDPDGADAVTSLNLMRYQIAFHRAAKADSDGDGFVDPEDVFPDDPGEWSDVDGDGTGDGADPDDDNDGVDDPDDPFPLDPAEWSDHDGDGIGDNADDNVDDLAPFRDPALRAVVEEALDQPAGATITADDMATLTTLTGQDKGIRNLTGLALATNLESLYLDNNSISDLTPLADLTNLESLGLTRNDIADLTPLAGLTRLRELKLYGNRRIADLSHLQGLGLLEELRLDDCDVSDLSPLAALRRLRRLTLRRTRVYDLSPLAGLELNELVLTSTEVDDLSPLDGKTSLAGVSLDRTPVSDLSPLAGLTGLGQLDIGYTAVDDLSPLAELRLRGLGIAGTKLDPDDVLALPHAAELEALDLGYLELGDIAPLEQLESLRRLDLAGNRVSDLAPLAGFTRLGYLELRDNSVSDIAPVAQESIWASSGRLVLYGNPLDQVSVDEHIPQLESWGVAVWHSGTGVAIPDPNLRWLIAGSRAARGAYVDSLITADFMSGLSVLWGTALGIGDLTGLETATNLRTVLLGRNSVSDLGALAGLANLDRLDLHDNGITDLSPLVENPDIGEGDWINLSGNPLSEEALNSQVPALMDRGVDVVLDAIALRPALEGAKTDFDVSGYFAAVAGSPARLVATTSDPGLAVVEVVDGTLSIVHGTGGGTVVVTVSAESEYGRSTLRFRLELEAPMLVPLFPSASHDFLEGFVGIVNYSARTGEVAIRAIDDEGSEFDPVGLTVHANETVYFNSGDLGYGNGGKGLTLGTGPGQGDWRLELTSDLDIEVLAYVRTADGFVTAMRDLAPRTAQGHRVAIFNPASNRDQVSLLRLANLASEPTEVTIRGIDDRGRSPGAVVRLTIPARAARTLSAVQLESGDGVTGAIGDGNGKWRLVVAADKPIYVMSLLMSPTGHLTNLSTVNAAGIDGMHTVPLFPAAADPTGRQGFVRVVNRSNREGTSTIIAIDDQGQRYEPVSLALGANETVHFNSDDLEHGGSPLSGGTGTGQGDWHLEITSELAIDVLAYLRTADGFLTTMHDTAPTEGHRHRVAFFNPASNRDQASSLRLVNRGSVSATAFVRGIDASGDLPGPGVRLIVPPGAVVSYTAEELESGVGLHGALGDGEGKWRLQVDSDQSVAVLSLLGNPTGHLTNLSSAPSR